MPVDQFLPHLSAEDAIGNHALRMRRVLELFGPSEIYVQSADAALRSATKPYEWFEHRKGSAVIYHASVGNPIAHHLLRHKVPVLIDYHNVTPMHFFGGYEPRVAALLYAGRIECSAFANRSPLAMADSEYSERELMGMGFSRTATIPILLDLERYEQKPNPRVARRLRSSKRGTDILFVGRLSPQKRQEDLIKLFSVYKRHFDAGARLFLVGSCSSPRYQETLEDFVQRLGLEGVTITGGVPFSHLLAYYREADVFVSMSEHEGFCVPLIEAMKLDLPVVAYSAAAIPETLGDAGLLFHDKRYEEVAALVHSVASDHATRMALIEAGRSRLEGFAPGRHEARLGSLIQSILE